MKGILLTALVGILLTGCSDGTSDDTSHDVVTASDRIFTFEDLKSIGYKKNRTYDVSELQGATGAWYGFWGEERSSNKDYEIRLYPTHEDAISLGESLAQEVTGDNAVITKDATWKEGIKDRRQVGGGHTKGTLELQATGIFPKYGNYTIYGNIVILCEGQEEIALEVCWKLIEALQKIKE